MRPCLLFASFTALLEAAIAEAKLTQEEEGRRKKKRWLQPTNGSLSSPPLSFPPLRRRQPTVVRALVRRLRFAATIASKKGERKKMAQHTHTHTWSAGWFCLLPGKRSHRQQQQQRARSKEREIIHSVAAIMIIQADRETAR